MSNYVVIDLEMCNVLGEAKKAYGYRNEIIEIGAVLLNESYEIKDSFKTYVLLNVKQLQTMEVQVHIKAFFTQ